MTQPSPRWLTAAAETLRAIDLGTVSVRDAAIYGRTRPLIPYAEGRLISSVRFTPSLTDTTNSSGFWLITPNTTGFGGFANIDGGNAGTDTLGLIPAGQQTSLNGDSVDFSQILDCGPLIAGTGNPEKEFVGCGSWEANTPYCIGDPILDGNDHIQVVLTNGVSGGSQPTFDDQGSTTNDGSVVWQDNGLCPSGSVHAIAEVIEGVSPMPPYPATLEFIQQPTDAAAEATISPAITVRLLDQYGQPYLFTASSINLRIFGAGTLAGTPSGSTNQTTGIATFNDLSITEPGTGYIIRAELYPTIVTEPIYSDPFDITAP